MVGTSLALLCPPYGSCTRSDLHPDNEGPFIHIAVTRRPNFSTALPNRFSSGVVELLCEPFRLRPMKEWRVQMSMKLMLSAAALVALGATSGVAAPAFVASPYCDQAVSRQACGNHFEYLEQLRTRVRRDTSLSY